VDLKRFIKHFFQPDDEPQEAARRFATADLLYNRATEALSSRNWDNDVVKVSLHVPRLDLDGDYEIMHSHNWAEHVVVEGCQACAIRELEPDKEMHYFFTQEQYLQWSNICSCEHVATIDAEGHSGPVEDIPDPLCRLHGDPFPAPVIKPVAEPVRQQTATHEGEWIPPQTYCRGEGSPCPHGLTYPHSIKE